MLGTMMHDPVLAAGTRFEPTLGVYAGWVAHAQSPAARECADGIDGEAYLLLAGECFPSSDAVRQNQPPEQHRVLQRYEDEGPAFVAGLNGLFSGLLVDPARSRALLFNDRYGSERLYIADTPGMTLFASEAKALLAVLPALRAFDDVGVAQFLTYGSTLHNRTLFRDIRLLPGGSLWIFNGSNAPAKAQYFQPAEWEAQPALSEDDFEARFANAFRNVLPSYVAADARIGLSLTGGLDTRMILACFPESTPPPVCYTYAGSTDETLDVRLAARLARTCGLDHHILRIGSDFLTEFGAHVDRTVFVTDGCAGALGAHELYYSDLARQLSIVRLTGTYGSEVLRSMSTFKPLGLAEGLLDGSAIAALARERNEGESVHPVTQAAFREIPWHLFGLLSAARARMTVRTPYLDNQLVRLAFQAPMSARKSPHAALQLVHTNAPALSRIPTDRGLIAGQGWLSKTIRRTFCEATFKLDYLHKEGLPDWLSPLDPLIGAFSKVGLLGLHKFLPYRGWFRRDLANYLADVVNDPQVRQSPYWNQRFLSSMVADHVSGRRNYLGEINAVLTLEAVERRLIRGMGEMSVGIPLKVAGHCDPEMVACRRNFKRG